MSHAPEPRLSLHPRDAARRGLKEGGLVQMESAHGRTVLRASLDDAMREGDVFTSMHWTDQFSASGPAGRLVHALTDPVSGQPDLKATPVQVSAITESWRGLLLRQSSGDPGFGGRLYWSRAPLSGGFAYELSGLAPLAGMIDSEPTLRRLLDLPPEAELISYSDPAQASFRYAGLTSGVLLACAFFAPPLASIPQGEWARALLGKPLDQIARLSLLAGTAAGAIQSGQIVCACFSMAEQDIRQIILEQNCKNIADIGRTARAGTNCGSCIPELKKLLGAAKSAVAA
jgi:assimilatory nitrate reductase catalytic subunit